VLRGEEEETAIVYRKTIFDSSRRVFDHSRYHPHLEEASKSESETARALIFSAFCTRKTVSS